jgi:hypothetical protein
VGDQSANTGTNTMAPVTPQLPAVCESLVSASIQGALAAIEIYNKPVFAYREQAFTVLLVNAWESLCKAKLAADAHGDIRVLYIPKPDGSFKTGRSGNFLTLELTACLKRLSLPGAVCENLSSLIEIRDTATHLFAEPAVKQLVHSLGVAALQNYYRLTVQWFGNRFADCKFQIMPLAFTYDFRTLAMLTLGQNTEEVARLLKLVSDNQVVSPANGEFYFICEISAEIRSVKKLNDAAGVPAILGASDSLHPVVVRTQALVDKYPFSYMELLEQVRLQRPGIRPIQIQKVIREFKVKENSGLAAFSFRTKAQREAYLTGKTLPKSITVIYNADAVRFIVGKLQSSLDLDLGQEMIQ